MSERVVIETPAQLYKEFDDALCDLCDAVWPTLHVMTAEKRSAVEADMEVLIAAWYRLHVATEPAS